MRRGGRAVSRSAWLWRLPLWGLMLWGLLRLSAAVAQQPAPPAPAGTEVTTPSAGPAAQPAGRAGAPIPVAPAAASAPAAPRFRFPVVAYFLRGGEWMWPILACSIIGVAVIIYKAAEFWKLRGRLDELMTETEDLVEQGRHEEAIASLEGSALPAAAVLKAGLAKRGHERIAIREAVDTTGQAQLAVLEAGLPLLSTVATIAPLFGFLGTVTGMIEAFVAVEAVGLGEASAVAGGIAKALITTAGGLIVAIPTFTAYNYFATRVKAFALDMERAATHAIVMATRQEDGLRAGSAGGEDAKPEDVLP